MFHPELDHSNGHLLLGCGAPGVGKGERFKHLSTDADVGLVGCGEICRDEIEQGTPIGKAILEHKKRTKSSLAPTDIILPKILEKLSAERGEVKRSVVLDGFGRVSDQVGVAIEMISQFGFTSLGLLIFKACRKTCVQRMRQRPTRPGDEDPEERFDDFLEVSVPAIHELISFAGKGFPIQVLYYSCEGPREDAITQAGLIKAHFCLPDRKK